MASPYIQSFAQLRLSGQLVTTTQDGRLKVGAGTAMMATDSGAFLSSAVLNASGAMLHAEIVGLSGVSLTATTLNATGAMLHNEIVGLSGAHNTSIAAVSTALTQSGVQIGGSINSLSGWANATFLPRGSSQSFISSLASGADSYAVSFPTGFAGKPRVNVTLEVSAVSQFTYGTNISSVTAVGFQLYLTDTLAETGALLHVEARL